MDSLAKNGKTIEEIQPKVEPTNSKPKAFEFDVPKTYRLNVPAEHFEAIIDNLVSKGTDFTFDDKKKQITTRDKHVPYYFESQKIPHTEISQKSKEEGR